MNADQIILFALLFFVFAFLIWGRLRYDLVAFSALLAALVTGVVPIERAFSGFGHPATVIIAMVLIISRGLAHSGAIELVARYMVDSSRKISLHIGVMSGFAAALSALMNNVAALALLMPVDMQAAAKARRSPALTLMPLSFASILGGMVTLIGMIEIGLEEQLNRRVSLATENAFAEGKNPFLTLDTLLEYATKKIETDEA